MARETSTPNLNPIHRRTSVLPEPDQNLPSLWEVRNPEELKNWSPEKWNDTLRVIRELATEYDDTVISHNTLVDQVATLQQRIDHLERVAVNNNTLLSEQEVIIRHLERQRDRATHNEERVARTIKLPDPPVFTDGKEPTITDWLSKMRNKLLANEDHYVTEALRKSYVETRVGGTASKHLAPRLRLHAAKPFETAEEMLELLETVFGDPHRRNTAMMEFRKLYQRSQDFNTFWAEFQRLVAELDFTEETLIDELRNRVSHELAEKLITEINVNSVYDLARKCQLYEQNMKTVKARKVQMTSNTSGRATIATTTSRIETPARERAKESSSALTRLGDAERQKLMTEGRCFRCKERGHLMSDCPVKRPTSPAIQAVELQAGNDELSR